ncbi:MAG TPA: NIPSNAP family protein [Caulobacter sp.]|nr:NIPSNAP family protein [Caulobacter sp.]
MMTRRTVLAAAASLAALPAAAAPAPAIVELRQYRMRPGRRDALIDLFEERFIESQEALGATVLGTFRDLDDPDRFVWLRGFAGPKARHDALDGFYTGPVWQENRTAANATIADSDDVLQLAPAGGFDLAGRSRAPIGAPPQGQAVVTATVCPIRRGEQAAFAAIYARDIAPVLAAAGAPAIGAYATDPSPNSYPRLPVREDATVFVWFQAFPDADAQGRFAAGPGAAFYRGLAPRLAGPIEVLRLSPTGRSLIQGPPVPADGRKDFDFLIGSWRVRHRRLKARLAGSSDWAPFEGWCQCRKTMGGLGNADDNLLNLPEGAYAAYGVRRFDPKLNRWSIWWLDARYPNIEPPVHGGFKDGVGTFIGEDTFEGRPILVRFTWSKITADAAHWSQAFSPDNGKTWEVNWEMDFERVG